MYSQTLGVFKLEFHVQ